LGLLLDPFCIHMIQHLRTCGVDCYLGATHFWPRGSKFCTLCNDDCIEWCA
jgi:hypothetical protein